MSPHIEPGRWPVLLSIEAEGTGVAPEERGDSAAEEQSDVAKAEREQAEAHADGCPDCDRERQWARQLLLAFSELSAADRGKSPAAVKAPSAILDALAAPARPSAQIVAPWVAVSIGAAFFLFVALGRSRDLSGTVLLSSFALLAGAVLVLRSRRALWFIAPLAVAAAAVASSTVAFEVGHGLRCAAVELGGALFPVMALAAVTWFGGASRDLAGLRPQRFATAAAAGALAGQAALLVTCGSHALGHLLVFHAAVVGLAAFMGAAIGRLPVGLRTS